MVEGLVQRAAGAAAAEARARRARQSAVYKKSDAALQRELDSAAPGRHRLHLEALPRDERMYIWDRVRASRDGDILLEVSRLRSASR
jgi:hypothetical protein